MRNLRKISSLALLLVSLVACAPDHGKVTDKRYEAAYTWWDSQCVVYDTKNPGLCKITMPVERHEPEHWAVYLDDGKDDGWKYVDENTFRNIKIGDWY